MKIETIQFDGGKKHHSETETSSSLDLSTEFDKVVRSGGEGSSSSMSNNFVREVRPNKEWRGTSKSIDPFKEFDAVVRSGGEGSGVSKEMYREVSSGREEHGTIKTIGKGARTVITNLLSESDGLECGPSCSGSEATGLVTKGM